MSPAEAIAEAARYGLRMHVEGSGLILEADREPPPEVVHLIAEHKPEIVRLLAAETLAADCRRRAEAAVAEPADPEERRFAEEERRAIQNEPELSRQPEGYAEGLKIAATLRPPRFRCPIRMWAEGRKAHCTGCGSVTTWRPDAPLESRTVVSWSCNRCFPLEAEERTA